MTYDPRKDVLEVARLTANDPPDDPLDVEAIVVGAIQSLDVVVDWIESGTPDDLRDAAELCNFAIDDLTDIVGGGSP